MENDGDFKQTYIDSADKILIKLTRSIDFAFGLNGSYLSCLCFIGGRCINKPCFQHSRYNLSHPVLTIPANADLDRHVRKDTLELLIPINRNVYQVEHLNKTSACLPRILMLRFWTVRQADAGGPS